MAKQLQLFPQQTFAEKRRAMMERMGGTWKLRIANGNQKALIFPGKQFFDETGREICVYQIVEVKDVWECAVVQVVYMHKGSSIEAQTERACQVVQMVKGSEPESLIELSTLDLWEEPNTSQKKQEKFSKLEKISTRRLQQFLDEWFQMEIASQQGLSNLKIAIEESDKLVLGNLLEFSRKQITELCSKLSLAFDTEDFERLFWNKISELTKQP